ncbi:hypothetical protein M0D21_16155 [Aquimarina sp. D1M17]|uniref:hypothetical protein n=1 Tax=Aquimarina acroporae TaxID=2937283 RepID=UPI0020BEFE8A|nr:hypothetical protein [Aquimarina acroporae]MCK8523112.1 hypothetical protein [Aquimarina acroporae]
MNSKSILFCILGIVFGEICLIVGTTFTQELVFKGIHYNSSASVIAFGGLLTFTAAIVSGHLARIVGRNYTILIPSVLSTLIIMETAYLTFSNITADPVWFDVLSGIGLIIGIWIGYHFIEIKDSFKGQQYYPDIP